MDYNLLIYIRAITCYNDNPFTNHLLNSWDIQAFPLVRHIFSKGTYLLTRHAGNMMSMGCVSDMQISILRSKRFVLPLYPLHAEGVGTLSRFHFRAWKGDYHSYTCTLLVETARVHQKYQKLTTRKLAASQENPMTYPDKIYHESCETQLKLNLSHTWRIIPFSKWLVTPIYKPFRPFVRGITPVRGLINHGLEKIQEIRWNTGYHLFMEAF